MIGLLLLAALVSCLVFPMIVLVLSIRNLRQALRVTDQPEDSVENLRKNYREMMTREEEGRKKERLRHESIRHLRRHNQ